MSRTYTNGDTTSSIPIEVHIYEDVFDRLNEYATAAQPTEIGGLAKVEDWGDGNVVVTDIAMLPQQATGGTFEIDADEVATFMGGLIEDLRAGIGDDVADEQLALAELIEEEVPKWCSIVHTHPIGMGASMSGVDVDNIKALADDGHFFSLILGSSKDADSERIAMHYAQATGFGDHILLKNLSVTVIQNDRRAAFEQQERERRLKLREQIKEDTAELVEDVTRKVASYTGRGRGTSWNPREYEWQRKIREEEYSRVWTRDPEWFWDDLSDDDDDVYEPEETKKVHEYTDEDWQRYMLGM